MPTFTNDELLAASPDEFDDDQLAFQLRGRVLNSKESRLVLELLENLSFAKGSKGEKQRLAASIRGKLK